MKRAGGSQVEIGSCKLRVLPHRLTAGATGSIPVPPTIQKRRRNKDLGSFLDRCCFLNGCF